MKTYKIPAGGNESVICPEKDEELLSLEGQEKYRSGVGILLWLMKHSKLYIANAVCEASKVMDGATKTHLKYLLWIIKYMIETKEKNLKYTIKKQKMKKLEIEGYCNSCWRN